MASDASTSSEIDNYLAVFTVFDQTQSETYTHYANPSGPGGPDMLTDPADPTHPYGPNEIQPSTVTAPAPEPSAVAIIALGGLFLSGRRRRA